MNTRTITKGYPLMVPFPCLFVSAIVYGGVLRLLDVYLLTTATSVGFYDLWLGRYFGIFCMGDIVLATGILFFVVAISGVFFNPRSFATWMTLGFCAILLYYTAALRYLPEGLLLDPILVPITY